MGSPRSVEIGGLKWGGWKKLEKEWKEKEKDCFVSLVKIVNFFFHFFGKFFQIFSKNFSKNFFLKKFQKEMKNFFIFFGERKIIFYQKR